MCASLGSSVAWSPNGFRLAFAGHGSSLTFIQILAGSPALVQTLNLKSLPFLSVHFLTDNTVVGAGFDCTPNIFAVTGGSEADPVWSFTDICDKDGKDVKAVDNSSAAAAKPSGPTKSAFANSKALFQASSHQGIAINNSHSKQSISKPPVVAFTRHTNAISVLWPNPNVPSKFVTSGLDGRVLFWDLGKVGISVK